MPTFRIDSREVGARGAIGAFAASVTDVFSVEPVAAINEKHPVEVEAWHLGTVMLGLFSGPALFFDRPPALVARSGLDHVLVQLYIDGGFSGMAGSQPINVSAGDICVFDLTDTLSTRSTPFSNLSLLVPRDALYSALDDLSPLHGMVLSSQTPLAGMLAEYLLSLSRRVAELDPRQSLLAAQATASLTSTVLAGEIQRTNGSRAKGSWRSPLRQVTAFIDSNIQDPDLDAAQIADSLGISRASLYRLFTASGGVGRYIRRRRLSGAAIELSDPTRRSRISDVALRWGFVNDASFARAFRQAFGIAPRMARDQKFTPLLAGDTSGKISEQGFASWMRSLHAGQLTPGR